MTTLAQVKKTGWEAVSEMQRELSQLQQQYGELGQVDILSADGNQLRQQIYETTGRIQGAVMILNLLP